MTSLPETAEPPLLECKGLEIGSFAIPPFAVGRGEVVQLVFSENSFAASNARDDLLRLLSVLEVDSPGQIRTRAKIATATPAVPFRRLSSLFRRQTLGYWLARSTEIAESVAETQLVAADLDPQMLIWHAAGNPRTALGVLKSLNTNAEVLVFWTAGMCDPIGARQVISLVFAQLQNRAAIYLGSPCDRECTEFDFANRLEIKRLAERREQRIAG